MSDQLIQRIQTLQFTHRQEAEALLKVFLREIYSEEVESVELRPLAVSLNSFNGFLTLRNGKRLFFKTHTEPDTVIGEYYNATQLANAGYPIIKPIFNSNEVGRQLLIYEIVESSSVFDLAWSIESGNDERFEELKNAQEESDQKLLNLYKHSLLLQSSEDAAKSPIHQLFYHRITGGRLARFYGNPNSIVKLSNYSFSLEQLRTTKWVINGQIYDESLNDVINRATQVLNPRSPGASVIGHGDAHNGNIFFDDTKVPTTLVYFDPAFAGRHSPLLDLIKPLFHNVFAMWMYFPQQISQITDISIHQRADTLYIEHNYTLHKVREFFLESKVRHVLIPTVQYLHNRQLLRKDWRDYMKLALFCCPFLTMNLIDREKFPASITLLGLAMSMEMGSVSKGNISRIDQMFDRVSSESHVL